MKNFQGHGSATLIGSMPHKDREKAIALVLKSVPEVPVWPQLAVYQAEQMMVQYIEGMPGVVEEEGRVYVRSNTPEFDAEALSFYEQYLAIEEGAAEVEGSSFALGPQTGATFRLFIESLGTASDPLRAVKGQVTGPFTLLSSMKDQDGRALIFDERFLDIVPKLLGLKARWQIESLKRFGVPVIMFLDEPGLAGFGSSAFITVSAELVGRILTEVVQAVHTAGALAGIHVCANTDWSLAFQSDFDIINFDAYTYFDKFTLYGKDCRDFLKKGGNLAWGIVPTSDLNAISAETPESLFARWSGYVRELASEETPVEKIIAQSLLTPACGCGSLPEPVAERVLNLVNGLSRLAAKK